MTFSHQLKIHTKQIVLTAVLLFSFCAPGFAIEADSRSAASAIALQQNEGGKVLSIKETSKHYKVKILVDGKVRTVRVDKSDDASAQ